MALRLQFTQDPYESFRANPPSGSIIGFKFKFRNTGSVLHDVVVLSDLHLRLRLLAK